MAGRESALPSQRAAPGYANTGAVLVEPLVKELIRWPFSDSLAEL
ncbi:MAG TPA: hypothetical protein VJV79_02375 [Polyangiaceae bacterium]|nr:hypothetical protein [Polyangiaceae bacterium]